MVCWRCFGVALAACAVGPRRSRVRACVVERRKWYKLALVVRAVLQVCGGKDLGFRKDSWGDCASEALSARAQGTKGPHSLLLPQAEFRKAATTLSYALRSTYYYPNTYRTGVWPPQRSLFRVHPQQIISPLLSTIHT